MPEKQNITIRVEGMTCDGCARHVVEALKSVAGVEEVEVSHWKSGQAQIIAHNSVQNEEISKAIESAGYHAFVVERDKREDAVGDPISCCC